MRWPFSSSQPKRFKAPLVAPTREARIDVARVLNRGELSAAPLERFDVVSIFDDEEYENYDFDIIAPRRRAQVTKLLIAAGFRHTRGNRFESSVGGAPLVVPKPGILGTDPSWPARDLLAAGGVIVLTTPTQALLLYLHACADLPADAVADELTALVWEQPANLDKAQEWTKAAGHDQLLRELRPTLEAAQAEGIELRRTRQFRSRLPR